MTASSRWESGSFVGSRWVAGDGAAFESHDPASGETVLALREVSEAQVGAAVAAARAAQPAWRRLERARREALLRAYEAALRTEADALTDLISRETGKPRWEARTEVDAMIAKVGVTLEVAAERRGTAVLPLGEAVARTSYRPIGVLAVLGPFNLPGHLPNGQIVPALLAGNAIVFKPSELTPAIGARMVSLWEAAGLPPGVLQLVQGGRDVGAALVRDDIDGVLFTGSHAGGRAISQALAGRPEVLLALEMGGNNPLVVDDGVDVGAAVVHTLMSAFITSGQRCTCARRLIVPVGHAGDRFLERLADAVRAIRVGLARDDPEPFMGPVISPDAAARLAVAYGDLCARGARPLVPLRVDPDRPALVHPGLIDVSTVADREDAEWFGPLLQVVRVADFDAAILEANRTRYGLAAGLLSDDAGRFERFRTEVRAGIINWNRQTTGASGKLPFGGLGQSGNHRPAGAWAVDFCDDPVASLESERLATPEALPPGLPEPAPDSRA